MPHKYRLIAATMALALSACAAGEPPEDAPADSLSDAFLALVLSPQYVDIANGVSDGHVVLVSESGQVRSVTTQGLDTAQVAWTANGLAFSNRTSDAVLSDQLKEFPRGRSEYTQHALFPLSDNRFVGVYNVGLTDAGYQNDVTYFGAGDSSTHSFPGVVDALANCGSAVYAVTHEPPSDKGHDRTYTLTRIAAAAGSSPKVISKATLPFELAIGYNNAPCLDGRLWVLHGREGENASPPADGSEPTRSAHLSSWDVTRGTHTMRPLLTESGRPLSVEGDALFRAQYSSDSVREGRLLWVSGDGVAHATELSTGTTQTVGDGLPTIAPSRSLFSFSGEHLVTLAPLEPGTDPDLVIRRLTDWQEVRRIRIPFVATIQSRTMLLRDFAIRPGFLP